MLPKLFKCPIKQISTVVLEKIFTFLLVVKLFVPFVLPAASAIASLLLPTAKSVNLKENGRFELFSFFYIKATKRI